MFASRLTRALAMVLMLLCAFALFVPQASAQSLSGPPNHHHKSSSNAPVGGCWEASCNNTDPYTHGCAGGSARWEVLLSDNIVDNWGHIVGYLQLWYSNTCDTNWARSVAYSPGYVISTDLLENKFSVQVESIECPDTSCSVLYTRQFYIPGPADAGSWIGEGNNLYPGSVSQ